MKLSTRSIFWTVVAAVIAVMTINMFMSLGPDARAMLVGGLFTAFFCVPIGWLAFAAGRRADLRTDDDEPTEHARDLAAYWQANGEVIRRQMELRAAYEQGRDHAREDASRQPAALNVWLVDEPANTSITRR
jgi:hypothetical protein